MTVNGTGLECMALGWIFFWAQCELLCACHDYMVSHASTTHTHSQKQISVQPMERRSVTFVLAQCQQMLGLFQRKEDITSAPRFDLYEVFAYAFREEWQITSTSVTSAESPMTPLGGLMPWTRWPLSLTSVCGANTFQLYSMCATVAAALRCITTMQRIALQQCSNSVQIRLCGTGSQAYKQNKASA